MTTAIFSPSEINTGDIILMCDAWSGKQWRRMVTKVTKATVTIDDFGTERRFARREDTFWNGDDYLMVTI
jgi:hypothetical protein